MLRLVSVSIKRTEIKTEELIHIWIGGVFALQCQDNPFLYIKFKENFQCFRFCSFLSKLKVTRSGTIETWRKEIRIYDFLKS